MMFHYKRRKSLGFSLVELMVVLAITAVLLSLTGGVLQRNIAQQERIVELEKINQLFHKLSYQAYYGAGPYRIRFQGNRILIQEEAGEQNNEKLIKELVFEQLTFVAQDYTISSKGVISPNRFSIISQKSIRQFSFKALFDEAEI